MPNVVTTLTADKQKVLILSSDDDFSGNLRQILATKNLATQIINPNRLLDYLAAGRQVLPEKYYKIIWAYGWSDHNEDFTKIIAFLRQREEPLLILANTTAPVESDQQAFATWVKKGELDHLFLLQVSLNLPTANLIFSREVLTPHNLSLSPLAALSSLSSDGVLLDPQTIFYFSNLRIFLSRIEDKIFNPFTSQKTLYRGSHLESSRAVEIINQVFTEHNHSAFPVVVAPVRQVEESFPFSFDVLEEHADLTTNLYNLLSGQPEVLNNVSFHEPIPAVDIPKPAAVEPVVKIETIDLPLPDAKLPGAPVIISPLPVPTQNSIIDQITASDIPEVAPPAPPIVKSGEEEVMDIKVNKFLVENDFLTSVPPSPQAASALETPPTPQETSIPAPASDPAVLASSSDAPTISTIEPANVPEPPLVSDPTPPPPPPVELPILPINNTNAAVFSQPIINHVAPPKIVIQTVDDPNLKTTPAQASPTTSRSLSPTPAAAPLPSLEKTAKTKPKQPRRLTLPIVIVLAALGVIALTLAGGMIFSRSDQEEYLSKAFASCGDLTNCQNQPAVTELAANLRRGQSGLWQFLPGKDEVLDSVAGEFLSVLEEQEKTAAAATAWYQAVTNQNSEAVAPALANLSAALDAWLQSVNLLQDNLTANQNLFIDANSDLANFQNNLTDLRRRLTLLTRILPVFEKISAGGQNTVALNILNHNYLRSGGGTITDTALLGLTEGKITSKQFFTEAQITEKIGGDLLIPPEISSLDSSMSATYNNLFWNTDGFADATTSAALLERASDKTISDLISIIPTIPTDATTLYNQFSGLSSEQVLPFLLDLTDQLSQKNLIWQSFDPASSTILSELGFDNRPLVPSCPSGLGGDTCILETIYQVDNNLNQAVSNAEIERVIIHNIELLPSHTAHERTISYVNRATTGTYLAYIRFILPSDADGTSVTINATPTALDASNGFVLSVPAGETIVVKLNFTVNHNLSTDNLTYSFFDQKQPGVINSTLSVNIRNTLPYTAKRLAPSAVIDGKRFRFSTTEETDFLLGIAF